MVKYEKINTDKVLSVLQQKSSADIEYEEIYAANKKDAAILECEVGDAIILYFNNRDKNLYIEML